MKTLFQKNNLIFHFFLCTVLLFSACRKTDQPTADPSQQQRLAFKDLHELYETLDQIDKMNETQIVQWEKARQHQSFREHIYSLGIDDSLTRSEESLLQLPVSYQVLLNRKGEIRVGDTIVWYNQGNKYYVHAKDEALLKRIQANPSLGEVKDNYTFTNVDIKGPREEAFYPLQFLDARYQREFRAVAPAAGCRKYVHELKGIRDGWYSYTDPFCGPGITLYVRLLMTIKLEWKNCSRTNWHPAGEQRTVYWNLNRNIYLRGVTPPCSTIPAVIPFTGTLSQSPMNTTSNVDIVLGSYAGNSRSTNIEWEVSLSGQIYHHINGDDINNAWNHLGQPFF